MATNPPNGGAILPNWGSPNGLQEGSVRLRAGGCRSRRPPAVRAALASIGRSPLSILSVLARVALHRKEKTDARSPGLVQVVRQPRRRRRSVAHRGGRRDRRPARAERRRQVDDGRDAVRPGRRRPGARLRRRRPVAHRPDREHARRQAPHRRRAAGALDLREPRRGRQPRALRRALRPVRARCCASASTRRSRSSAWPTAPRTSPRPSAAA